MANSRLHAVYALGQSIWYDNIQRQLITSGALQRLIDDDAVVGITSNPTIFEKAIDGSTDYDEQMRELVDQGIMDGKAVFDALSVRDIQMAADVLRPIFDRTNHLDGYISLEVSPTAANDTETTISEARRLFQTADRPNVFIKIPATAEGMPAIEQMIYEGVNINVTLIFALEVYEQVINAYLSGLERRHAEGKVVTGIASVASFFVSRVDTLVDQQLDAKISSATDDAARDEMNALLGKAAIANAQLAYEKYLDIFHGERFAALQAAGAQPQRCLWASTSTKNPNYRDVLYVEQLIAPETVDTMPPQTITAFQDHGEAALTLESGIPEAHKTLDRLAAAGIDMAAVTRQLELEGVKSFTDSYNKLIQSTGEKIARLAADAQPASTPAGAAPADNAESTTPDLTTAAEPAVTTSTTALASATPEAAPAEASAAAPVEPVDAGAPEEPHPLEAAQPEDAPLAAEAAEPTATSQPAAAPSAPPTSPPTSQRASLGALRAAVDETLRRADAEHFAQQVWDKHPGFWKPNPNEQQEITNRLGWLTVADQMRDALPRLNALRDAVHAEGITHVVLLGMGGSSLAPEVLDETFGEAPGQPKLFILDTTDPATIEAVEGHIDLAHTLFLVASKSGGTLETLSQFKYFHAKAQALGSAPGAHFIAITDPGTRLDAMAQQMAFRDCFCNPDDIGGRYSALSFFGLVPAALIGVDVAKLLDRATAMARACRADVPAETNPGVWLGAIMGALASRERDKVTIVASPPIATFGYWVEQLIAESTGKDGHGILPVEGEALGAPAAYGHDRLFVYLRTDEGADAQQDRQIAALQDAGQPVVRLQVRDTYDLGQEFFRWEFAVAVAGALIGINAFDQPNVQESKDVTDALLADYARSRTLPEPAALLRTESGQVAVVAEGAEAQAINRANSLQEAVDGFVRQAQPGDYLALLAYLPRTAETDAALQAIRLRLRDHLRVATTVGYGPRFQHSTGQLHKGGANNGVFLQFVSPSGPDLAIPDAPYTFKTLKAAQALGDLRTLEKHERRVVRLQLGGDVKAGLGEVLQAVDALRR
jgi:transaldolase